MSKNNSAFNAYIDNPITSTKYTDITKATNAISSNIKYFYSNELLDKSSEKRAQSNLNNHQTGLQVERRSEVKRGIYDRIYGTKLESSGKWGRIIIFM
jgi:hypothetical protein